MVRVYRSDLDDFYDVSEYDYNEKIYTDANGNEYIGLKSIGYTKDNESIGKDAEGKNTFSGGGNGGSDNAAGRDEAKNIATALYSYLPQSVLNEFINNYIKTGDADVSIGLTRKSKAWLDNFSHLLNDDGTLAMDELTSLATINTYKQTLKEVGISNFTDFEDEFKQMVTSVSGAEFQERIDTVYTGVVNQIPEVMEIYSNMMGIKADAPTVFAALINPKIEDKFLKGQIETVQLGAQAKKAGFNFNYDKFNALRKQGLTVQAAQQLYQTAGGMMSQAAAIGRDLGLETLEQSVLGDQLAQKRVQRIQSEIMSKQGVTLGAAKEGKEITGLIAD